MVRRGAARPRRADHRRHPALARRRTAVAGRLASYVRDRRIPLEMCPTSNVQTGAAPSIEDHPIGLLRELLFRVTVNTDNRLMSGVSLSAEFHALTEAFGYGWGDIEWLTTNAMKSAFAPFDERLRIINLTIKPGFAMARPRRRPRWRRPEGRAGMGDRGDRASRQFPDARADRAVAGRGGDLRRRAAAGAARAARRGPGRRRGPRRRLATRSIKTGRQAAGARHWPSAWST